MDTPQQVAEREHRMEVILTVFRHAGLEHLLSHISVAEADRLYEAMLEHLPAGRPQQHA